MRKVVEVASVSHLRILLRAAPTEPKISRSEKITRSLVNVPEENRFLPAVWDLRNLNAVGPGSA
jgi:hypothetical protein